MYVLQYAAVTAIIVAAVSVSSAGEPGQHADIMTTSGSLIDIKLDSRARSQGTFLQMFSYELEERTDLFDDRFGWHASQNLSRRRNHNRYAYASQINDLGEGAFNTYGMNALRETAVDYFLFEEVTDRIELWGAQTLNFLHLSFIADLFDGIFADTIGNTAEEEIEFNTLRPSTLAEESWWQDLRSHSYIRRGIRPDYIYVALALGRHEGQPIAIIDTRLYLLLLHSRLISERLQTQIRIPLPQHLSFVATIAVTPSALGMNDPDWFTVGSRLEYNFSRNFSTYLGCRVNSHAGMAVWGLNLAFN